MTSGLALYRVHYFSLYAGRMTELLNGIRPTENKIQRIVPGQRTEMDLILTEEEMAFIKLSVPIMRYSWLQEWTHRDERR